MNRPQGFFIITPQNFILFSQAKTRKNPSQPTNAMSVIIDILAGHFLSCTNSNLLHNFGSSKLLLQLISSGAFQLFCLLRRCNFTKLRNYSIIVISLDNNGNNENKNNLICLLTDGMAESLCSSLIVSPRDLHVFGSRPVQLHKLLSRENCLWPRKLCKRFLLHRTSENHFPGTKTSETFRLI